MQSESESESEEEEEDILRRPKRARNEPTRFQDENIRGSYDASKEEARKKAARKDMRQQRQGETAAAAAAVGVGRKEGGKRQQREPKSNKRKSKKKTTKAVPSPSASASASKKKSKTMRPEQAAAARVELVFSLPEDTPDERLKMLVRTQEEAVTTRLPRDVYEPKDCVSVIATDLRGWSRLYASGAELLQRPCSLWPKGECCSSHGGPAVDHSDQV